MATTHGAEPDEVRATVQAVWADLRPEIEQLFVQLWDVPEIAGLETRSSGLLAGWLESHGFAVERGACGLPTAFIARRGRGGNPRIGILAEYDALPGLHNEAVPYRQGVRGQAGHGCGHNHIGPANCGAAIAAALAAERQGLKGEIAVIGCPAEEILWGKVALLERGAFRGLDAILTSHGDYQNGAVSRPCQAVVSTEFVFLGQAGHGGKTNIGNALETAEQALAKAQASLADAFPDTVCRHVIRMGGIMPGITPDEVRVWCTSRHPDVATVQAAQTRLADVFRTCATAAGVKLREQPISSARGYLPNDVLGTHLAACLEQVGPPAWSAEDLSFMSELVEALEPGAPLDLDRDLRLHTEGHDPYGQDDGDASWHIPLGRINWAFPRGVPIHHWAWTALSGHPAGSPGPLMASEALALAAIGLLQSPETLLAAEDERQRRLGTTHLEKTVPGINATMISAPATFWDASWR